MKAKSRPQFNYELQVWTVDNVVQMCGHPERMREHGPCCNAARLAGQTLPAPCSPLDAGPL